MDAKVWHRDIITRMYHLMHNVEADNFDAERFLDVSPNVFFIQDHVEAFLFFEERYAQFFAGRELFADEESRALFDQLILFRLLGHLHVRLPFNTPDVLGYRSVTEQWKIGNAADSLVRFKVPLDGEHITMDCWHGNVAASFMFGQYCFSRGESVAPRAGDHIVDAGACFGDTALAFAYAAGKSGHVYAFDPIPKHCAIARGNFAMNPKLASRIDLLPFGLAERNTEGSGSHERDGKIDPGARLGDDLPTRTIDSLVDDGTIKRIDFVKMDIEGSEVAALKGAEQALRRWKPRLALSLYHRPDDLYVVPMMLNALGVGYRFHLDHYSIHSEETVLYAI